MFKRLRVKSEPEKTGTGIGNISISQLIGDASLPDNANSIQKQKGLSKKGPITT